MHINRLWAYISFPNHWTSLDTSLLDEISPSWFARREILQANSKEYATFVDKLKRRHAIETGIVERMYDIDKGVTETLINEGFISSLVSHGDTNIPKQTLFNHLKDHLEAVDFIFDVVKEQRPLTKGFICELHQLTTRHQEFTEGRDQFGYKTQIPLIKGRFKERENNPTREDGTTILYCPPEHVDAEMDRLIEIYNDLSDRKINPLIIATWVHHAFTTIHPFQDGNGRVVRLIASLILIKNNLFPITVLREEAKAKYIQALEDADNNQPQKLVTYFAEIQKRNIEEALNIKEVGNTTLTEVTNIFKQKLLNKQKENQKLYEDTLVERRLQIFEYCNKFLNEYKDKLVADFDDSVKFNIDSSSPSDIPKQYFYHEQIVNYAKKHNYYFNRTLPRAFFKFKIELFDHKKYELGLTLHHYGYDDSVIAIGAFLEYKETLLKNNQDASIPLDIKPHIISIKDDVSTKEKNIRQHLENILTMSIAQIASEI